MTQLRGPQLREPRRAWRSFGFAVLGLSLVWALPLLGLAQLAWRYDLYSHAFLVPWVSAYLVWADRSNLPLPSHASWTWGVTLGMTGFILAAGATWGGIEDPSSRLALQLVGYVIAIAAAGAIFLGGTLLNHCSFAFAFLIVLVPLPTPMVQACEVLLQHASAEVADWFFIGTRMPSIRDGLFFRLPGLHLEVAQECSGFRSSLVLVIVSTVAAQLFLRTPWKKVLLVLFVIPLGVARNAFRIYTLAALSVYVDPEVMNSALHRKGGPLFFALSLIPLNLLLWLLYRSDSKAPPPQFPEIKSPHP